MWHMAIVSVTSPIALWTTEVSSFLFASILTFVEPNVTYEAQNLIDYFEDIMHIQWIASIALTCHTMSLSINCKP